MKWALPPTLDKSSNQAIAAFIRRTTPSAHDDVATELALAIEGLTGVKTFCPDVHAYAYVVAYDVEGRIFALACGQSAIALRVGRERTAAAVIDGADPATDIGEDWVWFKAFDAAQRTSSLRSKLGRWCRSADAYVKGL